MSKDIKDSSAKADNKNIKKDNKKNEADQEKFWELLKDGEQFDIAKIGNVVNGTVLSVSKSEVKVDTDGVLTGVVRGPELYSEGGEYSDLSIGDEVEVTIIGEENENTEWELSFRASSQGKAWEDLQNAYDNKTLIKINILISTLLGIVFVLSYILLILTTNYLDENDFIILKAIKNKLLSKK